MDEVQQATQQFHFVRIFNEVNNLSDDASPLANAIVRECIEGATDESTGKFDAATLRIVLFAIAEDCVRFGDAMLAQGFVSYPQYCEHCGAGPADAEGELPHFRDCQEA